MIPPFYLTLENFCKCVCGGEGDGSAQEKLAETYKTRENGWL